MNVFTETIGAVFSLSAHVELKIRAALPGGLSPAAKAAAWVVVRGLLYSFLVTVVLVFVFKGISRLKRFARERIEAGAKRNSFSLRIQKAELISSASVANALQDIIRFLHVVLVLVFLYLYLVAVFSFFPWTQGHARAVLLYALIPLAVMGRTIGNYLPNLFFIAVICIVAKLLLKLLRFIAGHLARGRLELPGFYPEWAAPTYKIVRVLILAFALIAMFPYLPGSSSPAFRGVSIFLGLLVSLGSSNAISNVVAGVVLTYTRAFRKGDWVKISDAEGSVEEASLLVTRLRTAKNESISIPNAMVLGAHIMNYTTQAREQGLILHTSVTIGYDAPWRTVHELLLAAAKTTPRILEKPEPFVLETSLDDSFVTYELNAYTREPSLKPQTYSDLHQNIQDSFNKAGVEIMSPSFRALRDGNQVTIPQEFRSASYRAPSFRVQAIEEQESRRDSKEKENK